MMVMMYAENGWNFKDIAKQLSNVVNGVLGFESCVVWKQTYVCHHMSLFIQQQRGREYKLRSCDVAVHVWLGCEHGYISASAKRIRIIYITPHGIKKKLYEGKYFWLVCHGH